MLSCLRLTRATDLRAASIPVEGFPPFLQQLPPAFFMRARGPGWFAGDEKGSEKARVAGGRAGWRVGSGKDEKVNWGAAVYGGLIFTFSD